MTIIGIDDTDSRHDGMCTTYVGHCIANRLSEQLDAVVHNVLLVRLNPAAKHKTRGNAAVAIHTDAEATEASTIARDIVDDFACDDDDMTNPGVVVSQQSKIPTDVSAFTLEAIQSIVTIEYAQELIESASYEVHTWGNGRGRIGALAAIGAWDALDEWTYENITYREESVRGTEREVDAESVFSVTKNEYPIVWDSVDRVRSDLVCVPHTPGPILFGIRGDEKTAVEKVSAGITSETIESQRTFVTNQGTDIHLQDSDIESVEDEKAYRVTGVVTEPPETREGGHVFFDISECEDKAETLQVVAFEPTKHFRDVVRKLREGDELTVCGEVSQGTLKLEKFSVNSLNHIEYVNPKCPDCGRSMESAGANQGYRCRECSKSVESLSEHQIDRELSRGWYEVPPCARRHIAKPLVRGGFSKPTHPFQ